jgi:hypothetical protein
VDASNDLLTVGLVFVSLPRIGEVGIRLRLRRKAKPDELEYSRLKVLLGFEERLNMRHAVRR